MVWGAGRGGGGLCSCCALPLVHPVHMSPHAPQPPYNGRHLHLHTDLSGCPPPSPHRPSLAFLFLNLAGSYLNENPPDRCVEWNNVQGFSIVCCRLPEPRGALVRNEQYESQWVWDNQPSSISCLNCFCDRQRASEGLQVSGCPPPRFLPSSLDQRRFVPRIALRPTLLSPASSSSQALLSMWPLWPADSRDLWNHSAAAAPPCRAPVNTSNMGLWKHTVFHSCLERWEVWTEPESCCVHISHRFHKTASTESNISIGRSIKSTLLE